MTGPGSDPVDRAARLFRERFGAAPAGVWTAPGRLNLLGEHTDYNDGYVLPFALPQRTACAAGPAEPPVAGPGWRVHSETTGGTVRFTAADLRPGRVRGWAAYVAGVVWVLEAAGYRVPPASLAIASDVAIGAGLSSSAALECAVLTAFADLGGQHIPPGVRARLAQRAENRLVGVPCGIMDQSAAMLCRAGHALFLDCRSLAAEQIPFDPAGHDLAVLVIDSRTPHRLLAGEYAARRGTCEAAAARLGLAALRDIPVDALPDALALLTDPTTRRRVRHVVTENQRVLDAVAMLRTGRIAAIGPLLTASHVSMRDDYEITVPEVDTAVAAALAAGATGARMTGGGFGGCVLALVEAGRREAVETAVSAAFAAAGFAPPGSFVAVPSDGAGRAA